MLKVSDNPYSSLITTLIISLLYLVLFNSCIFLAQIKSSQLHIDQIYPSIVRDAMINYLAIFIIFFSFTFNRWIFSLIALLMFISGSIASYYFIYYDMQPTFNIAQLLVAIFTEESFEAFRYNSLFWCVCALAVLFIGLRYRSLSYNHYNIFFSVICLIITIQNIAYPSVEQLTKYFPMQYLHIAFLNICKEIIGM